MSITIGRTTLEDAETVTFNGDRVELTVDPEVFTPYEALAIRQQIAGLRANLDERVIPVTWTEDPQLDGFYRLVDAPVTSTPMILTTGLLQPFKVSLERVPSYANPWFEVTTQSLVRTNPHGITAPSTIIGYGPAVDVQSEELADLYPDLSSASTLTRKLSNGYDIRAYRLAAPTPLSSFRFAGRAAVYYMGAATLEIQYPGSSTWFPVAGKQVYDIGATATYGAPISAWRISNGIVRLTSVTAYNGAGKFEVWDNGSAAWESVDIWFHNGTSNYGGPGNLAVRSQVRCPVVIRNSPEEVVIKVQTARIAETWTIQRGAHLVVCHAYDPRGTDQYGIGFSQASGVAGTSITGGIRETSNNASGNRMVFACDKVMTKNTSNTYLYPSSTTSSVSLMVGVELGGSGAGVGDTAADLVDQFIGAVSWRQRVVQQ